MKKNMTKWRRKGGKETKRGRENIEKMGNAYFLPKK